MRKKKKLKIFFSPYPCISGEKAELCKMTKRMENA